MSEHVVSLDGVEGVLGVETENEMMWIMIDV